MSLGKSVKYVRGAIDTGQFVPAFKNYAIDNGVIQGSDGVVTLQAPIESDLSLCVQADRFARAVMSCEGDQDTPVELSLTDTGRLRVKQGTFRAVIPTVQQVDEFPWVTPEGKASEVPENFLDVLKALRAIVGMDATRPWSQGIAFMGGYAYATNNVVVARARLSDKSFEDIANFILPTRAVDELLRIGILPRRMLLSPNAVTFMHAKTWWMRSLLVEGKWPDVSGMFAAAKASKPRRITDEFRAAFAKLAPFTNPTAPMYLINGMLSTSQSPDTEDGALVEGFEYAQSAFMVEMFRIVLTVATHCDFAAGNSRITFIGPLVQGIMAGYALERLGPAPTQPTPEPKDDKKATTRKPAAKPATRKK